MISRRAVYDAREPPKAYANHPADGEKDSCMAERLILIRHGVTGLNLQKRFIGATDAPLAPEGERQAELLAAPLRRIGPDRILSSPMRRAVATAEIASEGLGLESEVDENLREIDFGEWEGLTFERIEAKYGEAARRWTKWEEDFEFPGGERIGDFFERVRRVRRMLAEQPSQTPAVFTHSGLIRVLLCSLFDIPASNFFSFRIAPGSITVVEMGGGHASLAALWRPGDYGAA